MKVYSAIMLCEDEVANHNCPTLLLAATEDELLAAVRKHINDNSDWRDAMDGLDIQLLPIDDINELLVLSGEPSKFVFTGVTEL